MASNHKRTTYNLPVLCTTVKRFMVCATAKNREKWGLDMSFAIPLSHSGPETLGQSYKTFYGRNLRIFL